MHMNQTIQQLKKKKEFITKHKNVLWNIIYSCKITGSKDDTIKDVIPNDINSIIKISNIKKNIHNRK